MHHRHVESTPVLSHRQREFLAASRTATLATIAEDGRPRLVPICFVVGVDGEAVHTPLDEKPKAVADPHDLERVRDILARPEVVLLVDRWSEEWSRLAWLRVEGHASLVEPGDAGGEHERAVAALRAKYPQYRSHRLEQRPIIRIDVERARRWGELG